MSADEAAAFELEKARSQLATQSQVVSILDLQLADVKFVAITALEKDRSILPLQRLELTYDNLSLHVRAAQSHIQSGMNRSSRSLSTEVEAVSGPVGISFVDGACQIKTGDFTLDFQERSSEAVIGSAVAITRTLRQIQNRLASETEENQRQFRRLVVACVNSSSLKPGITDPLAQAQPLFLLASGTPAAVRTNPRWRILTHIRHLLRFYNVHERATLQRQCTTYGDVNDSDLSSVQNILRQRLGDLPFVMTSPGSDVSLLQLLFNRGKPDDLAAPSPATLLRQPIKFSFSSNAAVFSLIKGDERTDEIVSGPFEVQVHSRQMGLHHHVLGTASSQASLNKSTRDLIARTPLALQVALTIKLQSCATSVSPHFIPFARHLLRVVNGFSAHVPSKSRAPSRARSPIRSPILESPIFHSSDPPVEVILDVAAQLPSFAVSTKAQHIAVDCRLRNLRATLTARLPGVRLTSFKSQSQLFAATLATEELMFTAHDLRPRTEILNQAREVLASLALRGAAASCVGQIINEQPSKFRATVVLQTIHASMPRSALRLYQLIEEWHVNYFPSVQLLFRFNSLNSFYSELELMLQGLVSELERESKPKPRARFKTSTTPTFDVHAKIVETRLTLHVMHGTWLSLDLRDLVAYGRNSKANTNAEALSFGIEIGGQGVSIGPNANQAETGAVRMTLPACRMSGTLAGQELNCIAVLDTFRVKLKPHHFDDILVIQQKFGADFNDLLDLVADTRRTRPVKPGRPRPAATSALRYSVRFNVQPFRIGIAGPSATQWFNVANVTGSVTNLSPRILQISVNGVGLELVPNAFERILTFDARSAIAYVSVDLRAEITRHRSRPEEIEVQIPRLHAVMQPSSIGELGDLIDFVQVRSLKLRAGSCLHFLQTEMLVRSQQRAAEIAEIRSKTKKVLRTWDIKPRETRVRDPASLFSNRIITFSVSKLGVAFPLTLDQDILVEDLNPHASATFATSEHPAFLLSISRMTFTSRKDEAGTASIENLAFQFVPKYANEILFWGRVLTSRRFNQAKPSDFGHRSHDTKNQLIYPRFNVDVRSRTSASTRSFHVSGDVEGFILSLDPTITGYIFSMADVYRRGKERLERLAPLTEEVTASIPRSTSEPSPAPKPLQSIPTSHIRLKLTFASGVIRLTPRDETHRSDVRGVFRLPRLTVWTEYKATAAALKFGSGSGDQGISTLLFSGLIHSSHNTLKSELIPFFKDIIHSVEARMKHHPPASPDARSLDMSIASASPRSLPISMVASGEPVRPTGISAPAAIGSMQVYFSLRIDESSLQVSCSPDSNVECGVFWKSGGFSLTVSPGITHVALTGYISGVSAKLRHTFVPETFFEATTENLAFSMAFSKRKNAKGAESNHISVIIDTELSVDVNMHRLQDALCLKAVWIDQLTAPDPSPITPDPPSPRREATISETDTLRIPSMPSKATDSVPLSTLVAFRSRRLRIAVDMPRAATATLEVTTFVGRANVSEILADLTMSFSQLSIVCDGHIAGTASIPDFTFQTLRRRNRSQPDSSANDLKMLQLFITSGRAEISLFSSGHKDAKLFHYE